ncbi:hypothetical protein ACWKWQ_18075, partial [Arthrobacter sp. MAHUQ-56]
MQGRRASVSGTAPPPTTPTQPPRKGEARPPKPNHSPPRTKTVTPAPGDLVPSRFRAKARTWRERHHPESI